MRVECLLLPLLWGIFITSMVHATQPQYITNYCLCQLDDHLINIRKAIGLGVEIPTTPVPTTTITAGPTTAATGTNTSSSTTAASATTGIGSATTVTGSTTTGTGSTTTVSGSTTTGTGSSTTVAGSATTGTGSSTTGTGSTTTVTGSTTTGTGSATTVAGSATTGSGSLTTSAGSTTTVAGSTTTGTGSTTTTADSRTSNGSPKYSTTTAAASTTAPEAATTVFEANTTLAPSTTTPPARRRKREAAANYKATTTPVQLPEITGEKLQHNPGFVGPTGMVVFDGKEVGCVATSSRPCTVYLVNDVGVMFSETLKPANCSCKTGSVVLLYICLKNIPYKPEFANLQNSALRVHVTNLMKTIEVELRSKTRSEFKRIKFTNSVNLEESLQLVFGVELNKVVYAADVVIKSYVEVSLNEIMTINGARYEIYLSQEKCFQSEDVTPPAPPKPSMLGDIKYVFLIVALATLAALVVMACIGSRDSFYARFW